MIWSRWAKGEAGAGAKAMNVKADPCQEYNQAAVIDKLINQMREMGRALAARLANIGRVTIVSTGHGDSSGVHEFTGDMTEMASRIPAKRSAKRKRNWRWTTPANGGPRSARPTPSRSCGPRLRPARA